MSTLEEVDTYSLSTRNQCSHGQMMMLNIIVNDDDDDDDALDDNDDALDDDDWYDGWNMNECQ